MGTLIPLAPGLVALGHGEVSTLATDLRTAFAATTSTHADHPAHQTLPSPSSIGQFIALALVLGSYFGAQYLRVWRPRRRGEQVAQRATALPQQPADIAVSQPITGASLP
jgi:hypothetical protein